MKKRKAPWRKAEEARVAVARTAPKPTRVSPEAYAIAWRAYKESPTAGAVAAAIKCSDSVASKLVNHGYPAHGMEPLRDRFAAHTQALATVGDDEELELMAKVAREARSIQESVYEQLVSSLQQATSTDVLVSDDKGAHQLQTKAFAKLFEVFDKAGRLASFAGGGADSRSEHVIPQGTLSENDLAALMLSATTIDGELE